MKYTEREVFAIWLDSFEKIEYKRKSELFSLYGGESIARFVAKYAERIDFLLGKRASLLFGAANGEYTEYILSSLHKKGVIAVTQNSAAYPEELSEVPCPPLVIYARGNASLLKSEKFAVVGSRKSSAFAVAKTEEFTEKLIEAGFTIVTGFAEGADIAAVKASLASGKIIAVLAGGFDHIYPKAHAAIFEKVVLNGLAISEYPPSVPTAAFHFPVRNRIIAGLGKGLLVMSGGKKSGTLYTAGYADGLSKQIFALPYGINELSGAGCNELIRRGAYLTECAEDVLEYYGKEIKTQTPALSEAEREVLSLLKEGAIHIDKLCARLNKRAFELLPVLSMLEIKKQIVRGAGNVYEAL